MPRDRDVADHHAHRAPILARAERYWESLRRDGAIPPRSALDPRAMGPLLAHAMVLDRLRHGTVRVRLGGDVARDLMGMDVRGLPVRAFFAMPDRARALAAIEAVFDRPSWLEMDLISDDAAPMLTASMLVLPLLDAAGQPTKALALLVPDRQAGIGPRRFAVTTAKETSLPGAAAETAAPHPLRRRTDRQGAPALVPGFAEPPEPYAGEPGPVPWLRVVK